MKTIKLTEMFYSLQGEGKFTGVPSVFFRTFGCNFTCGGFGMPKGEESTERLKVDPAEFDDLGKMPLVKTGCDSYASWDARFRHLAETLDVDEAVRRILELLPHNEFRNEHLVITGGEPLLHTWQPFWIELLQHPAFENIKGVTFETNGTQNISTELDQFLKTWNQEHGGDALTFSVSPKLPNSGEPWDKAIKSLTIYGYEQIAETYLKFVVSNDTDFNDVVQAAAEYKSTGFDGEIYLMPLGGVDEVYHKNKQAVANMAMNLGWRFSDRLQVGLWKNAWGT